MLNLTDNQKTVLQKLLEWYKASAGQSKFITLGGYAGTGKTTLVSIFRDRLNTQNPKHKVAFCAYTGKATRVLKGKLVENKSIFPKDNISTIHSLIYSPMINSSEEIIGWKQKEIDEVRYDLIIIDEASMVDFQIWKDLLTYGIPIIAVGDHGQLPPINNNFSLMQRPLLRLEEIHRQAKDNPIIDISIKARTRGFIPIGKYSECVIKYDRRAEDAQQNIGDLLEAYDEDSLILCGYNHTRIKLNKHIRQIRGFDSSTPQIGDRLICLRNNHKKGIFNGLLGTLTSIDEADDSWFYSKIDLDDEDKPYEGLIFAEQFNNAGSVSYTQDRKQAMKGDLFDFGYALTVHKAQGSQAKKVVLFEERFSKMDDDMWRRWLYTAVTRAEEELYIIG
jgi:exodeoxyribonuclease-5